MKSNLAFYLMAAAFRLRDTIQPPQKILKETGLQTGMHVLDFGCGPGTFSLCAARLVGNNGMVYALDILPIAIKHVTRTAARERLRNVQAVSGNEINKLTDGCIDMALLYDIVHHIPDIEQILKEIHRLLKENGLLSVRDHHLDEKVIIDRITAGGLFRLTQQARWSLQFTRSSQNEKC
jgi:ubiquinone/menaquinone biosynthesis C-methylase UbiE